MSYYGIDTKSNKIEFKVYCSKGTYIRSLCSDIAEKLETVGYMCELKRIQVGEFNIDQSIEMDEIQEDTIKTHIIPIEKIFKNNSKIELDDKNLTLFLNGVKIKKECKNGVYRVYSREKFIGTGIIDNQRLKRDIII